MLQARVAQAFGPFGFDLVDDVGRVEAELFASGGQPHQRGAAVSGVRLDVDVAGCFQLADQVAHRLTGHARALGEDHGPGAAGIEVGEDGGVRAADVRVPERHEPADDLLVDRAYG